LVIVAQAAVVAVAGMVELAGGKAVQMEPFASDRDYPGLDMVRKLVGLRADLKTWVAVIDAWEREIGETP
jgi:hypothetical protein